ncbi:MAG: hypothetical protein AB7T10_08325 [bacterium]
MKKRIKCFLGTDLKAKKTRKGDRIRYTKRATGFRAIEIANKIAERRSRPTVFLFKKNIKNRIADTNDI